MKKQRRKFIKKINRKLNKKTINNKVFCVGLHKTGTTTLANYFNQFGFKTIHSTDWMNDNSKLEAFDFFSDGGSHFDDINEFPIEKLYNQFENSKFILQTRNTDKWIISKLKHAGWDKNTEITDNDISKIKHEEWKYKSLLTIEKFIEHKINYENKVKSFFKEKKSNRLLVVDITNKKERLQEIKKLKNFLRLKSINNIDVPHSNKRSSEVEVTSEIREFTEKVIKEKIKLS
ncbi:MAG: sulfotransferase [Mesonia sp.]|uniref:sulfotransferase n=1 Tax=Mesonia sp. TaxID=1960830 RepID=UPI003242CAF7